MFQVFAVINAVKMALTAKSAIDTGTQSMNSIIAFLITQLANAILGSGVFDRILGAVERWAEKKISGAEKRAGVLDELEIIGLKLSESMANFGIELAVQYLKNKG